MKYNLKPEEEPPTNAPASLLLMKVGFHGRESLDEILDRKKEEEKAAGRFFWGYGGTLCNPLTQVLPFIRGQLLLGAVPLVALSITSSKFSGGANFAKEYSSDREQWSPLPKGVVVKSSKYAIVCKNLIPVDRSLDISCYKVAVGGSKGKLLSHYLRNRVDKACAVLAESGRYPKSELMISYTAELVEPYAVFLR